MNIQELRVGNWVTLNDNHRYFKVLGLPEYTPVLSRVTEKSSCTISDYSYSDLRGIPLTPEILEKCGFEYDGTNQHHRLPSEDCFIYRQVDGRWLYRIMTNEAPAEFFPIAIIGYLHELQNVFAALNEGQELTFTP